MPDHAKALEYAHGLKLHNEWRLGNPPYDAPNTMPQTPQELTAIIEGAISVINEYLDLHKQLAEARKEQQWQPIDAAPKVSGKEIIGTRWAGGVCIREPFVSFWSPTLNKFYCDPTHYIQMACPPLDAMPAKEGV
jgi:hypothetical protein